MPSFTPSCPTGSPTSRRSRRPSCGHFGTADDFVSVDDAKSLEHAMKDAGVDVRFEFYEGKGHAFFNDTDRLGTYDADAASESWVKTIEFLRANLA